jgi:arginine decarboxylase
VTATASLHQLSAPPSEVPIRHQVAYDGEAAARFLADRVPQAVMLCTPSILRQQTLVGDPLRSDVSVSYSAIGALIDQTGAFADIGRLIAAQYGADRALVMTDGSTGANQTAIATFARLAPDGVYLVDRQCHHSIPSDLTRSGLEWAFIDECAWDAKWDSPKPVTVSAVAEALETSPRTVAAVFLTSPGYAGQTADLKEIVATVRSLSPSTRIHVDQAWGSHLPWVPGMEQLSAMAAGADTASISLHKQAGALQPGAALLARDERVPKEALLAAYAERVSTSQSVIIAASVGASQHYLAQHGHRCFADVIALTAELKRLLATAAPKLTFFDEECPGPHDPTKLTLSLDSYATSGYKLRDDLEALGIVAEKASPNTLTFLVTLAATAADIRLAAATTAKLLAVAGPTQEASPLRLTNPYDVSDPYPAMSPTTALRHAWSSAQLVPAHGAAGKIAAERIEAYPPGIAIVFEGFRVSSAAIEWLEAVRGAGGCIIGRDPTLTTIRVYDDTAVQPHVAYGTS